MISLLNIVLLAALSWLATRPAYDKFGPIAYWGLIAKLVGALALGLTYFHVWEGGDTIALFEAIKEHNRQFGGSWFEYMGGLFQPIDQMSGNPRSVFFTRIMSPIGMLTGQNYWLMSAYLAVFSYWCTWQLISALVNRHREAKWAIIIGIGFLPSFIFWSSGLLKDTLANASCFFIASYVLSSFWAGKWGIPKGILAVVLLIVLGYTRHYLAGMLILTLL